MLHTQNVRMEALGLVGGEGDQSMHSNTSLEQIFKSDFRWGVFIMSQRISK